MTNETIKAITDAELSYIAWTAHYNRLQTTENSSCNYILFAKQQVMQAKKQLDKLIMTNELIP